MTISLREAVKANDAINDSPMFRRNLMQISSNSYEVPDNLQEHIEEHLNAYGITEIEFE